MNKTAFQFRPWVGGLLRPGFNLRMGYASAVLVIVSVLGGRLTLVHDSGVGILSFGIALTVIVMLAPVLYLNEKGKLYLRDAILAIFWALFFSLMLGYPVTVAARLFIGIPLQDARFIEWDRFLGVNVSRISDWSAHHWFGGVISKTYPMLFPFMQLAILLPILTGKVRYAQKFLMANVIAFGIGLPFFALLPGVGPWYGFHLAARPDQAYCTALVLLIRQPGPYVYRYPSGVICFPSFHVIWAVLCSYALWGYRRTVRIPACLFSSVIILSTLTIGNHYFCDVLSGSVLAFITIAIVERWGVPGSRADRDAGTIAATGAQR